MSKLNKASFEAAHNDASTGRYKAGQVDGIGSDDHRAMIVDIKDSVLFIKDHLLDEDNMASNSATQVPSQQSVKAYVDGLALSGLTSGRIPFATSSTTLGDDGSLHWDNTNKLLTIGDTNGLTFFADWNTSTSNRDNLILSDGMADWSNVSGLDNFGVGSGALHGLTAGSHNHAIGAGAGAVITSGEHNELIGRIAGSSLTIGSNNVIIGAYSDVSSGASGNVLLGYNQQGPTTGGQHVLIGYNVESVHPTESGELSIQNAIYGVGNTGTTTTLSTGNIGIYVQSPTARLHLPAGTAGAGKAPLKLTDGTALTTPEDGALEYHSSHLYFTIGSTRYQLDQQGGGGGWPLTGSETLTGDVTMSGAYSVGIGATPTAKFHVKGLGTTTGSLLLLEDSGGTDRLLMADNGSATFYSSLSLAGGKVQSYLFDQVNTTGNPTNGAFMRLSPDVRTSIGTSSEWSNLSLDGFWYHGGAATQKASAIKIEEVLSSWVAAYDGISFRTTHNISSGTGTASQLYISPTYNYTGTYAGLVYGLHYNPTLTSMTGVTHYAAAFASGNVVIGASTGNANAILDVQSTTKAFMPPRMTTTQRDAIPSPTAGMVIYNTTTNKLNVYTTSWEAVTSA